VQTLLAHAFDQPAAPGVVEAGLARVEAWYGPLWHRRRTAESAGTDRLGLHLWDHPEPGSRWPAWSARGAEVVATLHTPLGHERLLGDVAPEQAPIPLVQRLRQHPGGVLELTPPFVLAHLDTGQQTLTLLTDGLGLGRLYELRTPTGRVWSNRPVAALRFAGVRAEADAVAWRRMAASDWPMGERTPYAGVHAVPAATRVEVDRDGVSAGSLDLLAHLVAARRDPLDPATLDATADALGATALAVRRLWPGTPTLSLSGGRDSRLVVAAFLAAGVDVRLTTYAGAEGEVATARRLVALLDAVPGAGAVEHDVRVPAAQSAQGHRDGAYERARRWHDVTDGLRPAVYLRSAPPRTLLRHALPLITGVGGEFGHAPGYPDDVENLERLPADRRLDAFARALQAKLVLPRGLSGTATAEVDRHTRAVLAHATARGVDDAKSLDWYYADERLRRWGLAGESDGRVLPLLAPEFLAAAFGLTTAQSRAGALHTALVDRLVPGWSDVGYYSATLRQRQAVRQQRLWEEPDVELLDDLVGQPADWGEAFDVPRVQAVWRRAREGRAGGRDELLLQRVVWRAAFTDHLAAVNGTAPVDRAAVRPGAALPAADGSPAVPAPAPAAAAAPVTTRPPARDRPGLLSRLAVAANDVPAARRLARTGLGRWLRRHLGV